MPAAIPQSIRDEIWRLSQQGQDTPSIARAVNLPVRTARHLLRLFRAALGPCPAGFDRCGRRPCEAFGWLRPPVEQLRRQHPGWGAQRILCQLLPDPGVGPRPDPATVRRWLARAGLAAPARARAPARTPTPLARHAHQIWPMDACESKPLRDPRHKVCWLRLLDEASGAALFTRVYDLPRWSGIGGPAVQAALRQAFDRWGRPDGLRVDNGYPWVCPDSDLPTDLELWLAGLGVALHKGRPGVPQDNARIERGQRTAQAWAEPWQCGSALALQGRLDEEDRVHREVYLFDGERTRLQAYPELRHKRRPYAKEACWEEVCWDHQEALALLGRLQVQRKVDKTGAVSLYDNRVTVKAALAGQEVTVGFAAESRQWLFSQQGEEVSRAEAANLSRQDLRGLKLSRRPGRSAAQTRRRRARRSESQQQGADASPQGPNGPVR